MHNLSFQGTTGKLRLPAPSALRAPAAPELKRSSALRTPLGHKKNEEYNGHMGN